MNLKMNYKKIYNDLILKARFANRRKLRMNNINYIYYENHHIISKCLGGSDDKNNKVLLTAREHFIAHKLLVKIYPNNDKLFYAVWFMCTTRKDDKEIKISSKEYETIRSTYSKNISKYLKGKYIGEASSMHGRIGELHPSFGRTGKLNGMFGKNQDIFMCPYCGNHGKGAVMYRHHFENCKQNPNYILKEKIITKKVTCPYCKKIGGTNIMQRYHFDNCKLNPNYIELELSICPYCNKTGNIIGIKRWHLDNCKLSPNYILKSIININN